MNCAIFVNISRVMYNQNGALYRKDEIRMSIWTEEAKKLLDELVKPIPVFVRPMARKSIEKQIEDVASTDEITKDDVIHGYIVASPGKMQKRAVAMLKSQKIDLTPYEHLLESTKEEA